MPETGLAGPAGTKLIDANSIQFFGIEVCPTTDGRLYVGVGATICEREGDLTHIDLGDHRATSLDDALVFIRNTISFVH